MNTKIASNGANDTSEPITCVSCGCLFPRPSKCPSCRKKAVPSTRGEEEI